MGIVFAPLYVTHTDGQAIGSVTLTGEAAADGLDVGDGAGVVELFLRGLAEGYVEGGDVAPDIPTTASGALALTGAASGYVRQFGGGAEGGFGLKGLAYGAWGSATVNGFATGTATLTGFAEEEPAESGYGFLVESPPLVTGYGDIQFAFAREHIALGDGGRLTPTPVSASRIGFGSPAAHLLDGATAVVDGLRLGGHGVAVVLALVEDTVVLGALAAGDQVTFVRVIERLLLSGEARSLAEATAIVKDALVLGALIDAVQIGYNQDTLLLGETIDSLYAVVGAAVDRLVIGADATPHYLAMALVQDTVLLGDGTLHEADLTALVRESVGFAANVRLDNGEYIAWVMNTESKGLTRYTNYPFNSFAKIGGRYVGCSPQGLHWLDGDTDDGGQINARIRLGLEDMGTRRLKTIPDAYIGYTSDGVLLLRAIYTHETSGEKTAATYRLSPREAHAKREHRFKLGRGLKAVDWDFEIENVDGSDFSLSNVEFRPLILNRRTRG